MPSPPTVHLLDYVAGNIRSLVNAIEKLGYHVEWIKSPDDVPKADRLILPGVGHFGHCLSQLSQANYLSAINKHMADGKPFMGICVGLQALFQGSAEDPSVSGLGLIQASLGRFDDKAKSVPHIGWNSANVVGGVQMYDLGPSASTKYYYVHSYNFPYEPGRLEEQGWTVATASYGSETFVGAVARGNIYATQFHPEKSGVAGLRTLRSFLTGRGAVSLGKPPVCPLPSTTELTANDGLTRRVIACLDVRTNDQGDLVVTKGDQYDVRDESSSVRNLGKPVDLARRYYEAGADEITFLNITSFRDCPVADLPMLEVLRRASTCVFVPLTIGGGIRDTPDATALDVATLYFASGADKVSIGSDAVIAAEKYYARAASLDGSSSIELISRAYGVQAVVVSVDPRRVWLSSAEETTHHVVQTTETGPQGQSLCWYACTIKGGRETRDLDVVQLARAVQAMGAGELLLNSIDRDGSNSGFDLDLVRHVKAAVKIPVIASSGAGTPAHFEDVFNQTPTDAALGAGMFHRGEYTVRQVKDYLREKGLLVRPFERHLDDAASTG
ncbi:Imidazole glycerol phosphate synthase hisHF [Ophiocordyceps camponoti-floridani]|uniref:Imidazole glycerol phosphate synthase hisHF n=1 Tax=Ophiocordyceps camponoti-floridani TaxID=2030778 RepID=A0A8H4VEW9_9HYPO|nr:Imidazole glycerol phosphate synthase hisHF [Ophiocordyceps camponoti-floridani]